MRPRPHLRGATFIGLAISLVIIAVLGIIAAKDILPGASNIIPTTIPGSPTNQTGPTSPITGAANDVALADALSVANDAVALAAGDARAPLESDLVTAAGESAQGQGNVTITQPMGSDPASPRLIQLTVQINGVGSVNVCVLIPNEVGGTPVQAPCY
jgi:hypothetical protein